MTGTTQNVNPLSYMGVRALNPGNVTVATSAPTASTVGNLGDQVVNTTDASVWELAGISGTTYTWVGLGGGASGVDTINTNAPVGGNYTLAGTAAQIAVAQSAGTSTFSLTGPYTPATYTAHGVLIGEGASSIAATAVGATGTLLAGSTGADPAFTSSPSVTGSLTAGTTITATLGAITASNGNLVLGTAGNKIVSSSVASTTTAGANSFGTVTLATGTATISTTAVTASSIIMLTRQSAGATGANPLGMLSVGTITGGTSFVINALTTANSTTNVSTDVSVVGWMIIN